MDTIKTKCANCEGTGKKILQNCPVCDGTGVIITIKTEETNGEQQN